MKYIDAGYAVALSGLALYALGLLSRRRRLERGLGARGTPGDEAEPTPASSS